jgi:hypothetical protein
MQILSATPTLHQKKNACKQLLQSAFSPYHRALTSQLCGSSVGSTAPMHTESGAREHESSNALLGIDIFICGELEHIAAFALCAKIGAH